MNIKSNDNKTFSSNLKVMREITLSSSASTHMENEIQDKGSIFFIGNATVLIKVAGFTILTDPTFIHMHQKVHLGYGLKTTRLTNPAMEITDLPPLDLIVLSHFHGDHFDQVAIKGLDKSLPIVTTPHAADELKYHGFTNIQRLETWEDISYVKGNVRLTITSTPGRHGPLPVSIFLPQVMGSILNFSTKENNSLIFRMYITGDTRFFRDIHEIPKRYPGIDLALLHLGGTTILGILVTMDSKEGVKMFNVIDAKKAIPIHYNDYDVFKSPIEDFLKEIDAKGLRERITHLKHGEKYIFDLKR
jgi:L-ascorbate metabolism protein UlaG (beta-lactamase superfamily)